MLLTHAQIITRKNISVDKAGGVYLHPEVLNDFVSKIEQKVNKMFQNIKLFLLRHENLAGLGYYGKKPEFGKGTLCFQNPGKQRPREKRN